jgi:hypothetical protein
MVILNAKLNYLWTLRHVPEALKIFNTSVNILHLT